MNIQPHEYKPIVMRYLNGEATHEEEAMIDAFIKQGEEQAALFNQWMESSARQRLPLTKHGNACKTPSTTLKTKRPLPPTQLPHPATAPHI